MKKRKKSGIGLILLVVFFIYFAYIAVDQQKTIFTKDNELKKIQSKIDEETKENEKLKKEQDQIESSEFVEKSAREKLGYVKKNERVFIDMGK